MKPGVRALAAIAILLTSAGVVRQPAPHQIQRPNIVLIVSDDPGYADIGIYGSRDIPTPNINRIAQEGIRFTDALRQRPVLQPDARRSHSQWRLETGQDARRASCRCRSVSPA